MSFELFISRRYFKSKPNQTIIALITLLSIIGVAIGVTALIVVIAVMGGFESDLKARILGIEPHLVIDQNEAPIKNYTRDALLDEHRHDHVVRRTGVVAEREIPFLEVRAAEIGGASVTASQGVLLEHLPQKLN